MKYESFIDLAETVRAYPNIAYNPQQFMQRMAVLRASDPFGYNALSLAVGMPELREAVRSAPGCTLSREQYEHNLRLSYQLCRRLQSSGLKHFQTLWVASSWLNAIAWPFAFIDEAYADEVSAMPLDVQSALASEGDGYAASSLASIAEKAGESDKSAQWRKIAYDNCDLLTMRWMENLADKSSMPPAARLSFAERHAMLGDPEGLAAYALALLDTGEEEKAFRLAIQSADLNCAAGHFALYRCLMNRSGTAEEAGRRLDMAKKGGYPPAFTAPEPPTTDEDSSEESAVAPPAENESATAVDLLFLSIGGVWDQVDQEVFNMTGKYAPDQILADTFSACLCGAVSLCSPSQQESILKSSIREFCERTPDFVQAGYDEKYLNERCGSIMKAMSEYRKQLRTLYEQDKSIFDASLDPELAVEAAAVYEIIDQAAHPGVSSEVGIKSAIRRMFNELMED